MKQKTGAVPVEGAAPALFYQTQSVSEVFCETSTFLS